MSYILNEFVVVFLPEYSKAFRETSGRFKALQNHHALGKCISGPAMPFTNGVSETWTLCPDGSGEGWTESDDGDVFRAGFIALAQLCEYANIVHFVMGGDDRETKIIYESDTEARRRADEEE